MTKNDNKKAELRYRLPSGTFQKVHTNAPSVRHGETFCRLNGNYKQTMTNLVKTDHQSQPVL